MNRIRSLWESLRTSLWFVPTIFVAAAIALAFTMVELEARVEGAHLSESFPRLFGAGAGGSRGMLAAIASSMITVAGVAFSITIVALSLASSQYTSRVLRNFMRDRASQAVLGSFLGIFVYCLIVLRTLRDGETDGFVPSLAVLFAVVLALFGIGCLIFFLHHMASAIQVESILRSATGETLDAIERLFPEEMGEEADADDGQEQAPPARDPGWQRVPAWCSGYLQLVDADALLELASAQDVVIRMERGIGEFVVEGAPLVSVHGDRCAGEAIATPLARAYLIGTQRTMVQDVGFGIRQIVDVALKALSPGINDTTTAVTCVHYLSVILARLAARRMENRARLRHGELRVIARSPTFRDLLNESFDQIRQNAAGNVALLQTMLTALEVVALRTTDPSRRQALRAQVANVTQVAGRSVTTPCDVDFIRAAAERVARALDDPKLARAGRLAAPKAVGA